jgi:hypothetical protein
LAIAVVDRWNGRSYSKMHKSHWGMKTCKQLNGFQMKTENTL